MKNLENFNVAPMSQKEMRETEGGFWFFLAVAITISLVVAGVVAVAVTEASGSNQTFHHEVIQPGN